MSDDDTEDDDEVSFSVYVEMDGEHVVGVAPVAVEIQRRLGDILRDVLH